MSQGQSAERDRCRGAKPGYAQREVLRGGGEGRKAKEREGRGREGNSDMSEF